MRQGLFWVGAVLTACWLLAAVYFFGDENWKKLGGLQPNELGDFFAGLAAPLAFLWLVLGFIQQGIELRLSSEALRLQAEELKSSVEQQRSLLDATRLHFVSDRRPWLSIVDVEITSLRNFMDEQVWLEFTITLQNSGTVPALQVKIAHEFKTNNYSHDDTENLRSLVRRDAAKPGGYAIAPGGVMVQKFNGLVNVSPPPEGKRSTILAFLQLVVHYQGAHSADIRETSNLYLLHKAGSGATKGALDWQEIVAGTERASAFQFGRSVMS